MRVRDEGVGARGKGGPGMRRNERRHGLAGLGAAAAPWSSAPATASPAAAVDIEVALAARRPPAPPELPAPELPRARAARPCRAAARAGRAAHRRPSLLRGALLEHLHLVS